MSAEDELTQLIRELFGDEGAFYEWLRRNTADALAQLDPFDRTQREAWLRVRGLPDQVQVRFDRDRQVLLIDYGGKPLAEVAVDMLGRDTDPE
jgi:hypothetical protein